MAPSTSDLIESGRYSDAVDAARRDLRAVLRRHGPASAEAAESYNWVGVAAKFAGQFDVAEDAYARAMPMAEAFGPSDLVATILHNVGGLAHSRGCHREGLTPARRGLAVREQIHGPSRPSVGLDCAALAGLLEGAGDVDEAEALYRRALSILDSHEELSREAALARNGLGSVCQSKEQLEEAEAHYRLALAQFEAAAGLDHPQRGHILNNLATLHRRRGKDAEARELLTDAYQLLARTLGPDHPVTAEVADNKKRVESSPSPYV